MKINKLIVEIIVVVAFIATVVTTVALWKSERKERIRTELNQNSLLTGIKHYKTKDSLNAVAVRELTLTRDELKEHEAELVTTVRDMGIKLKHLQRVTSIGTETTIVFQPVRKDSLIYIPGKDTVIRLDCMEFKDAWTDFIGCYDGHSTPNVSMVVRDSIEIVGHVVPKHLPILKFIKYGVKSVNVDIKSYNPSTDIKYARDIKLK
jgi:hypothetical protein